MTAVRTRGSLRRRLLLQLLLVAAILSVALYFTVRALAQQAAETTQDNILIASATAISEAVRAERGQILVDVPYSALSMLGSIAEERVFYRITADDLTVTGYDDLPVPSATIDAGNPVFATAIYRGDEVRIAALPRRLTVADETVILTVLVAQTRLGLAAVSLQISIAAAAAGIGFFVLSGALSWFATNNAMRPLNRLAQSVARRGPQDLSPVETSAPTELVPLLQSLNTFMGRLSASLARTEDFIAEAAHHVRTPLATVRTQSEIAMRSVRKPENKQILREVIRAADESSRSAGQLLDHAMVALRSDNLEKERLHVRELAQDVIRSISPTADLKDIRITCSGSDTIGSVEGDPILLQNALRNLLDNAVKYSPEDSIIKVEILQSGSTVRVDVIDEGRGLGDGDRQHLTERFGRGNNVRDIIGSGLGLTIVEEVMRAHGGTLKLSDNPEKRGTCASISLPLA
ncbi:sensor histidine kinase [uncultured Roseibium sp.]|uniref:sensor histidine kinase n=1 Tax=uncultured Roseibium sp. TaxID=1936171 RepID=UPI00262F8218|nr:sensor histidine kinase [uncultured Roseibium sp.]